MGHDVRIDSNKQSVQYHCHAHVFSRHPGCHPDLEFGYADCLVSTLQLWLMHAECTLTKTCSLIIATVGKSILSMDTSLHDKKRWQQSRTQRPSYRNKPLWKTRRSLFKEIHRPVPSKYQKSWFHATRSEPTGRVVIQQRAQLFGCGGNKGTTGTGCRQHWPRKSDVDVVGRQNHLSSENSICKCAWYRRLSKGCQRLTFFK
jgi:hypothetical protein